MPDGLPLSGITIVVTRPRRQGESTARALRGAGASVIELPVLEITKVSCQVDAGALAKAYAVIFVSANAVEYGLPCLHENGGPPPGALMVSIGHATTRALTEAGIAAVVSPQQSIDSEGLLAMPQLQQARVNGQHVVLVRGKSATGGRKLLEETLAARGARVLVLECYERRDVLPSPGQIESLVKSMKSNFAMMALSVETLDSLMKAFAGRETLLQSAWLLVPHARVAAAARARHFARVVEVGMSAEALIPALTQLKTRMNDMAA